VSAIFFYWHRRPGSGKFTPEQNEYAIYANIAALLWLISPLLILFSMNLLVMWVAVMGIEFK
jgi:hypothetical protein